MDKYPGVSTYKINGIQYFNGRVTRKGKTYTITGHRNPEDAYQAVLEARKLLDEGVTDLKHLNATNRDVSRVTCNGMSKTRLEWAAYFQVNPSTLWRQAKAHGRTVEEEIIYRLKGRQGASQE